MRKFRLVSRVAWFLLVMGGCQDPLSNVVVENERPGEVLKEIVGGIADPGHPYTVRVGLEWCSGSLISPRTVVSAAHCAQGDGIDAIYFGDVDDWNVPSVAIEEMVEHPAYSYSTNRNDLLLIRLAEDAPVPPVPLLRTTLQNTPEFIGPRYTFVGFGRTGGYEWDSGSKRVVTFPITVVGPADVDAEYGSIDETMFFYSVPGVNTCNGDSGGPAFLVREGVETLAGVTSFGDPWCEKDGVQSRTDWPQIQAFIQPTIDSFEPNHPCRSDGTCNETCTRDGFVWDADCHRQHCAADGICATACALPVDPDCASLSINYCGKDGMCDPSCPAQDTDCDALCSGAGCSPTPSTPASQATTLVINEIDYDQPGDDGAEFIELYNAGAAPVDLTGLKLVFVNGTSKKEYWAKGLPQSAGARIALDASGHSSLGPDEYLVVGNAAVASRLPKATAFVPLPDNSLQNGVADAIGIWSSASDTLVDSLSYEGDVRGVVIAAQELDFTEGAQSTSALADPDFGDQSLARFPNGADTNQTAVDLRLRGPSTPGQPN